MDTPSPAQKPDLAVRTVSAIVMLALAGVALWFGGWVWMVLVVLVALGVLWEWNRLVTLAYGSGARLWLWRLGGVIYIGVSAWLLVALRTEGLLEVQRLVTASLFAIIGAVIGTDIGAYLFGRAIGGPKIAPRISPSKTWAGLFGGMVVASLAFFAIFRAFEYLVHDCAEDGSCGGTTLTLIVSILAGSVIALIAQAGDFFESAMKRRAGVKDSGNLIPGHGGLFDRVDGLIAVMFVLACVRGIVSLVQ